MAEQLDLRDKHRDLAAERLAALREQALRQSAALANRRVIQRTSYAEMVATKPEIPAIPQTSGTVALPVAPRLPKVIMPKLRLPKPQLPSLQLSSIKIPNVRVPDFSKVNRQVITVVGIVVVCLVLTVFAGSKLVTPQAPASPSHSVSMSNIPAFQLFVPQTSQVFKEKPKGFYRPHARIESLGLDFFIDPVGLTQRGDLNIPADLSQVSWYQFGTKPGNTGSAVIAAHTGAPQAPGIFSSLKNIYVGDSIELFDGTTTMNFKVTDKKIYRASDAPLKHIFEDNDKARLNLITSAGDWDGKDYSSYLVVYTERTN